MIENQSIKIQTKFSGSRKERNLEIRLQVKLPEAILTSCEDMEARGESIEEPMRLFVSGLLGLMSLKIRQGGKEAMDMSINEKEH